MKGFVIDAIVISYLLYLDDINLYSKFEGDMATLVYSEYISNEIRMSWL